MATNTVFRYPLDPTGAKPENKVIGEEHTLTTRPIRGLAPNYGLYFTESLVVTDRNTGLDLTSSQYKCVEFQEVPAGKYGKSICAIILITDTSVSNNISITYQVLGGEWSSNEAALVDMINNLDLEDRPVSWPMILNRPDEFNPAPHFHDAGDIYGFEYVVHALNRLRQAILIGDEAAHDELRRYIDTMGDGFDAQLLALQNRMTDHEQNTNNPHSVNKTQVGLSSVENYPIATVAEATTNAASVNNRYVTPALVRQCIAMYAATTDHVHTFASLTSKPTTLPGYGVNEVNITGLIRTTNVIQAGASSNASYLQLQANEIYFVAASGVVQGRITCSSTSATTNGGTITYTAATHAFTGNVNVAGTISATGDVAAYSSDARLKTEVLGIENASDKLFSLGGYWYRWDLEKCAAVGFTPDNEYEHGLLAQQVQAVLPDAVVPTAFNPEYLTVKYHRVVPLLVAGHNEHTATIVLLTKRIEELEKKLIERKE